MNNKQRKKEKQKERRTGLSGDLRQTVVLVCLAFGPDLQT